MTTSDAEATSSCNSYLRAQSEMQSLLVQIMDKIGVLTEKQERFIIAVLLKGPGSEVLFGRRLLSKVCKDF